MPRYEDTPLFQKMMASQAPDPLEPSIPTALTAPLEQEPEPLEPTMSHAPGQGGAQITGTTPEGDIAESFDAGSWSFTPAVTEVFDEHVAASVPFYAEIQELIAEVSDWLLPHGSTYADIGCSTGTTAAMIASRHPDRTIRGYLYDEQSAMLDKTREKMAAFKNFKTETRRRKVQGGGLDHMSADLTTALFTLQFLHPRERQEVLTSAHQRATAYTGALLVAEKIRPVSSVWHEIGIDLSHDYKSRQGITDASIRSKSRSLRGVLQPQSFPRLMTEIESAGWQNPEVLFRWHQWTVIGATA